MNISQAAVEICREFKIEISTLEQIPDNDIAVDIPKGLLVPIINRILKYGIWHLSAISCYQKDGVFFLLYHFWNKSGLTFRINLGGQDPQIDSICQIIPGANFYEREAREMFGIEFANLPNPEPLFLPDNWKNGYPMRETDLPNIDVKIGREPKK